MTARDPLIRLHLQALVPLRMQELQTQEPDALIDWLQRQNPEYSPDVTDLEGDPDVDPGRLDAYRAKRLRDVYVRNADELMFGHGEVAGQAMRRLVTALAIMALVAEGGVTFAGMHWCSDHQVCIDAERKAKAA